MADPSTPTYELPKHPYGGRAPMTMGISWTLTSIAIILMILRTYTNIFITKSFGWDYHWAAITLATGLFGQILQTVAASHGLGNHVYLLAPAQLVASLKWVWLGQIVILNAIGFGKLAVCALLLHIQDRTQSKKKWFIYFVGISGIIINIDQTVLMLTQCSPLARQWDRSITGTCDHVLRTAHVGYFQGSWAALSDILLAVYPIFVFRNLKVSRKVKAAMFVLLGGGVLAGAASAIKTVHIKLIAITTDITYGVTDLVIWGLVECWLVLILGSLPPLRSLFLGFTQSIASSRSRSRRPTHGYQRSNTDKVIPLYNRGMKQSNGDDSHESEECIITDSGGGGAGIRKTTDIQISRGGNNNNNKDMVTVERMEV